MNTEEIKEEIKKLKLSEKLLLVEDVWDDIAATNDSLPLYDWQKQEIERRLEAYKKGEYAEFDWQAVHQKLRDKHK